MLLDLYIVKKQKIKIKTSRETKIKFSNALYKFYTHCKSKKPKKLQN